MKTIKVEYCMRSLQLSLLCIVACLYSCQTEIIDPEPSLASGAIITIAGTGPDNFGYDEDGTPVLQANLGWVVDVAVDNQNNLYMVDGAANNVRRFNPLDQQLETLAGKFLGFNHSGPRYEGDGGPGAEAVLNVCLKMAIDPFTNDVWVTDNGNSVIRQISASSGVIETAVGFFPGVSGFEGDGGPANQAKVWNPQGIAFDAQGNIYISDTQNHVIRRIEAATGVITTIAGLGPDEPGYSGDGGLAVEARLNRPGGLAIDGAGNIYVSDGANHVIRLIEDGRISTIAGNGVEGSSGNDGPALSASLFSVHDLALDQEQNLYLTDGNNVRKIDLNTGIISNFAGIGTLGYSGDGGPAVDAELNNPWGIAVDEEGNVYIADSGNAAVRMVRK